ncbi:unnamed protein product [Adineta ricciae]|uniref:Uncharacterized protein n=1 Tax=Adineta ricciae TaxID=249248 RepID=A0A815CRA3_ADIRI|nr:unnamed protein product [Adineta ricciae]CAF1287158.1 unnamed protein product [Adineta ricciae]
MTSVSLNRSYDEEITRFVDYLLDTVSTTAVAYNKTILEKENFYQSQYSSSYKKLINQKLQQWKDFDENETIDIITEKELSEKESESEDESSPEDEINRSTTSKPTPKVHVDLRQIEIPIDPIGQCERLLQFLYHCQQRYPHFVDLYFHTLNHTIKCSNEKINTVALQQIARHLSDGVTNEKQRQRLIECIPSKNSLATVSKIHKPICATIQNLLSTSETTIISPDDLDTLYPYRARFFDLQREFRDSAHYFIDGDSFLLSIAHHINVDLLSYFGNTLHVIYLIERILLTLFNQTRQCNYSLLFFDCHHQFYQQEKPILSLIRSCLIAHLSKNINQYQSSKVQQFSSWFDEDYKAFVQKEKPHFVFYHDMSSFDFKLDHLLCKQSLTRLLYIYRLFGIYHQYSLNCHAYLMNKLALTDTYIKCFQVNFHRNCSESRIHKALQIRSTYRHVTNAEKDQWIQFERQITDQMDLRLALYIKTIKDLMEMKKDQFEEENLLRLLSPLLILHMALLIRLSLVDRHLPEDLPSITFSSQLAQLIIEFQQQLAISVAVASSSTRSCSKIADLYDGRLFAFTLYQLLSNVSFHSDTMCIFSDGLLFLEFSTDQNLFHETTNKLVEAEHLTFSPSLARQSTAVTKSQQITRISNRFIDTCLQPIISNINNTTFNFVDPQDVRLSRYEGKYHWHVYKEVGDEISRVRNNDETYQNSTKYRYRTQQKQRFYTYFTLYGNSLTSRDVRDSHLQIVLPTVSPSVVQSESKKKEKPPKKIDLLREKNQQKKMADRNEDEADQLIAVLKLLDEVPIDNYARAIDILDAALLNFKISSHRLELLKRKFRFQRKYLQSLRKKSVLTNEENASLELLQVNYFATISEMANIEHIDDVFEKKTKYLEELIDQTPLDREEWYRFQMNQINSRLPRRENNKPDQRVIDFIPDDWQVKFLDAVDKRQSIIIVAPTASGKTYASYYAMNKVLKDEKDQHGLCVYIAPTKALVNQVAATIHSKFGPVFGIFTRDYRVNMDSCRILVTVPQCMEILLLSPTHQQWCQRIKYAIFDEIHCMSGEIGADVWEKTMLLINCPMIGLSATVNNSDELRQWITNVERQRAELFGISTPRQVCLIVHHERAADLNKYLYSNRELHPIHPIGIMNAKQLVTKGIPKDLSLSPRETLQLEDLIKTKQTDEKWASTPPLAEYFSSSWIIERSLCNEYSKLVHDQFNQLIDRKDIHVIDSIITSLQPMTSVNFRYPEPKPTPSLIVDFILTLKEKNLLPCIVFTDNRALCEHMAHSVATHLYTKEKQLRETKYKIQLQELRNRLELAEQNRQKSKPKKSLKSSRGRRHAEDDVEEIKMVEEENKQILLSGHEEQLLNGILDEGTLASRQRCDRALVDALLERAHVENPRLVSYMKRGVAYHHSGLNNKGRVAVEALFRNRYIQVVFSTATLALGIHMPTKSVAFIQDSIYLDALQYRQASGRAGRRGFDIQGHVIFIDIPLAKISHLFMSAIPNIHAHFPTSVTFLLRLLHLCANAKDVDDAINRSLIALQCSLMSQSPLKSQLIDVQTRFHCLFTLDFLYRLNLIDRQGGLVGLAGLLSHLHYFEPANILLIYLMDTRLFHEVRDQFEIITIFAYLFTNMPWLITPRGYDDLVQHRKEEKLNSKLFLAPISKKFRQRVDSYNSIVKEVYGCYIQTIIQHLRRSTSSNKQEEVLPFSSISFAQTMDYDNGTFEYRLHHHYSQQMQNPTSISPFAALSGLTHEKYMSRYNPIIGSWDLIYDIDLSSKVVPFIDIDCCDHTNTAYHLNSYAFDFYKHGSEKLLIMENWLNAGDTYNLLLDFKMILASVKTSLEVILNHDLKEHDNEDLTMIKPLYRTIENVHEKFSTKFRRQYPNRNKI